MGFDETADPIWQLKCYRVARCLIDHAAGDVVALMRVVDPKTVGQLSRAVGSIGANLAEGYSRRSAADRSRFYGYALGSTREATLWYRSVAPFLDRSSLELRMAFLARRFDIPSAKVLATIALERMLDFLVVLLLLSHEHVTSTHPPAELETADWFVGGAGLAILACAVLWVGWTQPVTALVRRATAFLPGGLGARITAELERSADGLAALRQPRLVAGAAALSILQWACMSLGTAATVAAVGVTIPLSAGFVIVAVTVAGLILPSSPGYVGTTQLCFALALAPFGVASEDAVAASIVFNVACWVPVTLVGLVVLWHSQMSLRMLLGMARADPH